MTDEMRERIEGILDEHGIVSLGILERATDTILALFTAELERVERGRDEALHFAGVYAYRERLALAGEDVARRSRVAAEARATAAEARLAEAVEVMGEIIDLAPATCEMDLPSMMADRARAFMEQQG